MQKPNANHINVHMIGATEIERINTAPEASNARHASTRKCPTVESSREMIVGPIKKPTKQQDIYLTTVPHAEALVDSTYTKHR